MFNAYQYKDKVLRENIPPNVPGVYLLGNVIDMQFIPIYVGRSDACLLSRLIGHNHRGRADYLVWRKCNSVKEAYNFECMYYHDYENDKILNLTHPASPQGSSLCCPICSNYFNDVR